MLRSKAKIRKGGEHLIQETLSTYQAHENQYIGLNGEFLNTFVPTAGTICRI
jgi:hypothetical protein